MSDWSKEEYERKLAELKQLEELQRIHDGLPHLYGFKFYPWQKKVWLSTNREIFVCSANQVGKSTIAIRKNIRLATDPSLWPTMWPNLPKGRVPNLFWYFYPTIPVAQTAWETAWLPTLMPKNEFKNHPQFGWEEEYDKGYISKIRFNTGVQIQFKSYSMKAKDLQTASVYHVTADEEMPVEYLPELKARTNATEGHFLMVFTATLGQLHWQMTMEPPTKADEKHPDALKIQASLYDSQVYDDGTPSPWTDKKIEAAKQNCPTEAEVQRRVYGRFVRSHGLRLESFSLERNMSEPHPMPSSWVFYGGVDPGSGGQSGHPAAMVIIAVSPDYKQGRVVRGWRGDGVPTAASDILDKYRELKGKIPMAAQSYDWAAKDFFTVASRVGESFIPADKGRDAGFGLLNTLFKNGMLKIQRGDPELDKLVHEICTLPTDIDKKKASDDLVDALRYAAMAVPWDFSDIELTTKVDDELAAERKPKVELTEAQKRREWFMGGERKTDEISEEFDFWNELSGASGSEW
jgi:hypothetical protein